MFPSLVQETGIPLSFSHRKAIIYLQKNSSKKKKKDIFGELENENDRVIENI